MIIRNTLSSLIIVVLSDYPLVQTSCLMTMDVVIILFLYLKNPFKTFRGKLAQYFYEITTLLVHISTFSLSLKPSDTGRSFFSTTIIYLNTALITGAVCFMFFEIYKTINVIIEQKKAARLKERQVVPQENQNLTHTVSPLNSPEIDNRKRPEWSNLDQTAASPSMFNLLPETTTPNGDAELSPIMKLKSRVQNRRKHKISSIFPISN